MKHKHNYFFILLKIFFILYVIVYILGQSGYYENHIKEKTLMTDIKIQEFENDLAANKIINSSEYLEPKKDYANVITKSANFVTRKCGTLLNKRFSSIFDFIKTLFLG